MISYLKQNRGFTMVELILVIVIIGILGSIAVQKIAPMAESIKIEETKAELDKLAIAIVGNPQLQNNGVRSDFGYVGDIGSLPSSLSALVIDPGYATWNGPYMQNSFEQYSDDYNKDAWQTVYSYAGGVSIISTGSGSNFERRLAGSKDYLLYNKVAGNVYDLDGTPPGDNYNDSIAVQLIIPDGAGSLISKSRNTDVGGYFSFDSIPIGNHTLRVIYVPDSDTMKRFVSVTGGSNLYSEYYLPSNVWSNSDAFAKVAGSDSLYVDCHGFFFWVENNSGSAITINSVTVTWSSPTAYYRYVKWNGTTVVNRANPHAASGEVVPFTTVQTINDGQSSRVDIDFFKANINGGPNVDMNNVDFTIEFSDGTSMAVTTGACP